MHTPESYYLGALKRALEGDLDGALAFQEKAEKAREAFGYSFSEVVSDTFPFIEEAVTTLLSSYDFTRCVKPDGTAYGTAGQCRKGTASAKEEAAKMTRSAAHKAIVEKRRAARDKGLPESRWNDALTDKEKEHWSTLQKLLGKARTAAPKPTKAPRSSGSSGTRRSSVDRGVLARLAGILTGNPSVSSSNNPALAAALMGQPGLSAALTGLQSGRRY